MELRWASSDVHKRYLLPISPRSRTRCHCGCKKRATHLGMANGISLMEGCEFFVRRWVRDGAAVFARRVANIR